MRPSVFLILAAVLLAGCADTNTTPTTTDATLPVNVAPGPDGPGSLPNGTLAPPSITLGACVHHEARFPLGAGALESVAPAGFTAAGDGTELVVQARRCTLDERTYNTMLAGIPVEAPAPYALDGASHLLLVVGINTHSEVRDLWAAWGLAQVAQKGDSAVLIPAPRPVPGVTHSDAANENFSLDLYVTVSGTGGAAEETVRNLVAVNKAIVGIYDEALPARTAQEGTAVVQVAGPQGPPAPQQTNGDAIEYFEPFDVTMTYVPVQAGS